MKKVIAWLCVLSIAISISACRQKERLDDVMDSSVQNAQSEQTEESVPSGRPASSEPVATSRTETEQESRSAVRLLSSAPDTTAKTDSKSKTSSAQKKKAANPSSAAQTGKPRATSSKTATKTSSASKPPQTPRSLAIVVNGKRFSATLYENETVTAFRKLLPLTLTMTELNGNEKYCDLDSALPTDASCPENIHSGDLMLYGNRCLVLFYESFSTPYRYTALGKIDDPSGLAEAVGTGDVQITFEVQ